MGEVLHNWICLILFRVALPLTLLVATVVRFNLFSFIYGCLMLSAPLLKRPSYNSLHSHTGRYLTASVVLCSATLLSQVVFQIYVNTGDRKIGNCSDIELILHHIGLEKVSSNVLASANIIVPDIAAFIICLTVFICCRLLLRQPQQPQQHGSLNSIMPFTCRFWPPKSCPVAFDYFAKFFTLVVMTLAGILQPSIIGSVYFLSVLMSVTVWSVFIRLRQCWFQRLRFFLLLYAAMHLIASYIIQLQYTQTLWISHMEQNGTFERLLGLTRFVDVNCTSESVTAVRLDLPWAEFINIFVVILFYFILALELRRCRRKGLKGKGFFKAKDPAGGDTADSSPELAEGQNAHQHYSEPSVSFNAVRSDSPDLGSVVIGLEEEEHYQNKSVSTYFGLYVMKQSYIGTLIIMMAWSIAYHSWLTFIFLLGACFIWILPQKQAVCLRCSPLIVIYAVCLLILQYIYAFNLTNEELPTTMSNNYKLQEIGLVKYVNPAIPLGIKIGFTCMFWLTLRQFSWQRSQPSKPKSPTIRIPLKVMTDANRHFSRWMWHKLCKYWILACAALFLLMALREAVIFRIIYMALFLCFVITFQLSYRFWRLCIKTFWWLVILYSMFVLGCIYTYQFEGFPGLWQNRTGMSEKMLSNLGLRKFDTKMLFVQLLTPTSFLIVIIMQLHYFQKTFLTLSDLSRFKKKGTRPQTSEEVEPTLGINVDNTDVARKSWKDRLQVYSLHVGTRLLKFADTISFILWRFLEIHMFKFVVITIFFCCAVEVNVLNTVLVVVIVILLPFDRLHWLMSIICLIWSSAVLLLKMVYQLDTVSLELMVSNCLSSSLPVYSEQSNGSVDISNISSSSDDPLTVPLGFAHAFNLTRVDNSQFVGLQRESNVARYLMIYVIMVLMLVLEAVVKYHQIQYYNHPDRTRPSQGIMFASIKWSDADRGLKDCCMFLANYTFYKFGKELCLIMTMVTMVVRVDVFSVLYGVFLGILLLLRRRSCSAIWPIYVTVLTILLLLQYLSCLGTCLALCWENAWTSHWTMASNLFLPSYIYSPRSHKLIADFLQLLMACLQWKVFGRERTELEEYGGGSNYSIICDVESMKENPHKNDFTSYKNSYLDYVKMVVFFWSFWLTLMIVLISGMSRISLFCMGYLIGCFVFLWFGEEMLLKPLRKLIRMWMGLLFYCYFVLFAKCFLQLIGSVSPSYHWVIQLLNVVCLESAYYKQPAPSKTPCQVSQDGAGLSWDAVCFVFLLLMVRVFKSWYFQHVVTELTLRNSLAARGAELINQHLLDEVQRMRQQEDEVLLKIKEKMKRIKERHRKCLQKKAETVVEPNDHYLVIRSGDYYMFEDMTDEEEEMEEMGIDSLDNNRMITDEAASETPDWRARKPSIGPIAIINAALIGGTKEALNLAGGRSSMFSMQTSRRSSSTREYVTPDFEPPSSPVTAPPILLSDDYSEFVDLPMSTPSNVKKRPQVFTSTPSDHSTSSQNLQGSRPSPRKQGILAPCDAISTVVEEEVSSCGEDDVFDGKEDLEGKTDPVVSGLNFIWVFAASLLDSLTAFMYNLSRKYRSISRLLDAEKQEEKLRKKKDLSDKKIETFRRKSSGASLPLRPSEIDLNDEVDFGSGSQRPSTVMLRQKNKHPQLVGLRGLKIETSEYKESIAALKTAEKDFHSRMPRLLRLMIAVLEALMSRTDLLCYFVMVLNVLLSASILSILFPISVFFWGMLSVPRPTKTYWITVITYTEAIIVLKYLFQFIFFPWNEDGLNPLDPQLLQWLRVIGIEEKEMYAAMDFFLLFCLFLHRMVLKSHGLWKDAKALESDLKGIEVKRSSPSGSPESPQPKCSPSCIAGIARRTDAAEMRATSESPEPSKDILMDSGVDTPCDGGQGLEAAIPGPEEQGTGEPVEEETVMENRGKILCVKLCQPVYDFFCHMRNPQYSAVTDVYAFMFACDLVTFLIVVFGYSSFGPASVEGADVATVLQQSRVPVPFLAMLLVQFVLIIIDRALYLRRLVFGKFLFHIFLVILVHIWMFFLMPAITDRAFTSNVAAQLWYLIKCVYFALSCYQIRSGYPTRILGNFLTKDYNYLNLFCFKGFLAVPFLLELRALMDWMWTDTTLALTSWLQMEDIYANIFVLKCWRRAEVKYPTPRGLPRSAVVKYGLGGLILVVLIFIIWFPLLLFSLSGSIFKANPPLVVDLEIKISGYQPIFSMTAQFRDIEKLSGHQFDDLKNIYKDNVTAQAFLMSYRDEDVYEVRIRGTSSSTWEISHPSERHLRDVLVSSDTITFLTVLTVRREPISGSLSVPMVAGSFTTTLNGSNPEDNEVMQTLADMIDGAYNLSVTVPHIFPRYITVPSQKRLDESRALLGQNLPFSSVRLSLHQDPIRKTRWWQIEESISGTMNKHNSLGNSDDETSVAYSSYNNYLTIVTFNERIPTGVFSVLNNYGVIGLYVSVILVIGRLLRMQTVGNIQNIMFTDLPFVDRIHGLCKDIYLARQASELPLEEFLFSKLNFLYRSPETIIKWTRRPKQKTD